MANTFRILICCAAILSPLTEALSESCDVEDKASCNLPPKAIKSLDKCEGEMIKIHQGEICGELKQPDDPLLANGRPYLGFSGIPFARPPVDKLRLMDPVPAGPWEGIRDGSWPTPMCPQFDIAAFLGGEFTIKGNEDCLYLNVYRPKIESRDLPVMVFIHGGAYILGGISELSAEKFMTQDIILVTIQYRLGFLGFFSTGDSDIPGNQGLIDQELALRWVRDNIAAFGGDKDRVTIFGESAGAVSVHLQMLNPQAAGLFSRAILQSGTAFLASVMGNVDHQNVAKQLTVKLNCTTEDDMDKLDNDDIIRCLQSTTPELLVSMGTAFIEWNFSPAILGPRIDGKVIPDNPTNLLKEGKYHKVDIISGTNKNEGMMVTKGLYSNPQLLDDIGTRFSEIAKHIMPTTQDPNVVEKIMKYYMGSIKRYTDEDFNALTEMFGHHYFHLFNDISMELHARDTLYGYQVFAYELHHRGNWSFMEQLVPELGQDMVNHADELQYMFSSSWVSSSPTQTDIDLSKIILKLWSNFAAYGNPTPDRSLGFTWSPVSLEQQPHLVLMPQPHMEQDTRCEARAFFESLNLPLLNTETLFPGEIAMGNDWKTWRVKNNNGKC